MMLFLINHRMTLLPFHFLELANVKYSQSDCGFCAIFLQRYKDA
jgi:hypothetical protein